MNAVIFHTDSEYQVLFPIKDRKLAEITIRRMLRAKKITSFSKITNVEHAEVNDNKRKDDASGNHTWLVNNATLDDILKASKSA